MSYVDNIKNSIVISYVSSMDVKDTILSLINSSPGYDVLPASIAKQYIDNYDVPFIYFIYFIHTQWYIHILILTH